MEHFALSRDNDALLNELNLTFPFAESDDKVGHSFEWQRGEFCAIVIQQKSQSFVGCGERRLIFGRDVFGRKSLCWRITKQQQKRALADTTTENGGDLCQSDGTFHLSVLPGRILEWKKGNVDGWSEVPPGNVICLTLPPTSAFEFFPNAKMPAALCDFRCHLPSMRAFLSQTLCVHTFYPHKFVSQNALFTAFNGTEFKTAKGAQQILLGPSIDSPANEEHLLLNPAQIEKTTDEFVVRFSSSLHAILLSLPPFSAFVVHDDKSVAAAANLLEVSVLFSGGVDSLMVALTAAQCLSSAICDKTKCQRQQQQQRGFVVRMFSVAFGDKEKNNFNEASDRTQSIAAYEYLKGRSIAEYGFNAFSLVLVNVNKEELIECRQKHIADAIAPSKTVLDDSIGCVLWFASRMKGIDFENGKEIICDSPFALVGSGSDEQLGGYARHQTVFKNKGLLGLADELSMEMHRIGARNFGRDDRIGTTNGRSILAPFLEEPFVCWLNTLPIALKTGFGLLAEAANGGTFNKFLLRNALRSLGVPECFVQRPKRAMQFGTRMVKMEAAENGDTKMKGHQICDKLSIHHADATDANATDEKANNHSPI